MRLICVFVLAIFSLKTFARVVYDFDSGNQLADFQQNTSGPVTGGFLPNNVGIVSRDTTFPFNIHNGGLIPPPFGSVTTAVLNHPLDANQQNAVSLSFYVRKMFGSNGGETQQEALTFGYVNALSTSYDSGGQSVGMTFNLTGLTTESNTTEFMSCLIVSSAGGGIGLGSGQVTVNHWYRGTLHSEKIDGLNRYGLWGEVEDLGADGLATPTPVWSLSHDNEFIGGNGTFPLQKFYPAFYERNGSTASTPFQRPNGYLDNFIVPEPSAVSVIFFAGILLRRRRKER